jgi:hypothetical protein
MKFDPDWVVAPAEMLQEWMDENGQSVKTVPAIFVSEDKRPVVTELLQEVLDRKPLTKKHLVTLGRCTGIPIRFWENFEKTYRAGLAAGRIDVDDDKSVTNDNG